MSAKLILLRHGESEWNRLNVFTGWVDIPLSANGIEESLEAGRKIADLPVDVIFVSALIRAQMTAMLAMSVHKGKKVPCLLHPGEGRMEAWGTVYGDAAREGCIPVHAAWELNERMYGKLQGLNKRETMDRFGEEQVRLWRRSYDVAPPDGESLAMTAARAVPYFQQRVLPLLYQGKHVLIAAHGNSLRAICMFLDRLSKEEVLKLELATGEPILYTFAGEHWSRDGR
jgi:2,3-bisphosphoglycerate-dependent phosphoglycerate mutase